MDQKADLFLARTGQPTRWEDEEKATNHVEELRREFRRRLYAEGQTNAPAGDRNVPSARDAK